MRDLAVLIIHCIATLIRLLGPGGAHSVVAESLLLKHQLLILNRSRERAPNLRAVDRKYRLLFSPKHHRKPGPKGPSAELVAAIVEMKRRNPKYGCRRIAQQISFAFGLDIDKDIVRRVLARHYRPDPGSGGPSWLPFFGHARDSLWSVDWFRCESLFLRSHWVMVVMDQFSRRIIGLAVHVGDLDGPTVCRLFNKILAGQPVAPRRLSSDNDPFFKYRQWRANLRILEVTELKTVPYVPLSHPFVERLIGTIRRELLDQVPFWIARDLERKLCRFQNQLPAAA